MGDIADLVTAATAVATVLDANVTRAMPAHAHAIPRGTDDEQLRGWVHHDPVGYRYFRSSPASRAGLASDTSFDVVVTWQYGGSLEGRGLFIKDAQVYVEIQSIGLAQSYSVTAKFDDAASWEGDRNSPVAVHGGSCEIFQEFFGMTESSTHLTFQIKGDGTGRIGP